MKFLANENYPLAAVRKIAAAGHEIESVTLMMQGQPDITILLKNNPLSSHLTGTMAC